jgi:hypothetical protein
MAEFFKRLLVFAWLVLLALVLAEYPVWFWSVAGPVLICVGMAVVGLFGALPAKIQRLWDRYIDSL